MGDPRLVGTLALMLTDPDEEVRLAAVLALGSLRDAAAFSPLVQALSDPNPRVRASAVAALGTLGDPLAVEALVQRLADPDGAVRRLAIRTLEGMGWQPKSDAQRIWHAVAHGRLQRAAAFGPAAVEPLSTVLRTGNPYERKAAAEALAGMGDPRVLDRKSVV